MKSTFTNERVNEVMEQRGINRKSAQKWLRTHPAVPVRKVAFSQAAVAPAKDVKMAQANDKTLPVFGPTPKAPKSEAKVDAGAARAEGLRLYKIAGRPSQADVKRVFGTPKAIAWTWLRRAKVMELATAEEAALKFQEMLASK